MAPTLDTRYVLQLKTSFFGMLPRESFACEDDRGRTIRNLTAVEFPDTSLDDRVECFITTKLPSANCQARVCAFSFSFALAKLISAI